MLLSNYVIFLVFEMLLSLSDLDAYSLFCILLFQVENALNFVMNQVFIHDICVLKTSSFSL
jgi:hypothetical protein